MCSQDKSVRTGADGSNVTALTAEMTSTMSSLRGELLAILNELRWMTNKVSRNAGCAYRLNHATVTAS
jgi:hypothetical protein